MAVNILKSREHTENASMGRKDKNSGHMHELFTRVRLKNKTWN